MTVHSPETQIPFADPLDQASIGAIISGQHGAPFDLLGPHSAEVDGQPVWIVRTFAPGAESVTLIPGPSGEPDTATAKRSGRKPPEPVQMRQLHPAGLFSAVLPAAPATHKRRTASPNGKSASAVAQPAGGEAATANAHSASRLTAPPPTGDGARGEVPPYTLEIRRPGGTVERIVDPYAFAPQLTDFDLHLMGEGKHYDLYEKLGAHPTQVNGVPGVRFAVWAPNARRVSVVGDFNGWDERTNPMHLHSGGVWEIFVPGVSPGALYKYAILSWNQGHHALKADPYAFWAEVRPGTASRVYDLARYQWHDAEWVAHRPEHNGFHQPILVYELHVGSWRPSSSPGGDHGPVSYRDLAHQLVPYLHTMGYTHVELLPVAEHPFDGSWGYQVTGYFAPTSRYGTPHDFMYFVDYCHQHEIGVILDWVPAHFPKDAWALGNFDGSHLYEHADARQGEHPEWGTYVFNFGRNEVRNFLVANALFWLDKYHIDGLRVDAVASMLYLDYGRKSGEWLPNRYGGRENLEAVEFLKEFNESVHIRFPGALTIAEESTAWPKVTWSPSEGGLGFSLKWNMGWMHDILEYFALDSIYREHHHNQLTFSTMYMHSERFILPFSHDEVVHMKGSMLNKMAGDRWQKFANLRALYAYMIAHPGKKLMFMGGEFGQWSEWHYEGFLDWHLLAEPLGHFSDGPEHEQLQRLVQDLNHLLREHPSLYQLDFSPEGFTWIDGSDAQHSVIAFVRYAEGKSDPLLFVTNFTPVPRHEYRVGVPSAGFWAELLNTDASMYGGSNVGNLGGVESEPVPWHGREHSVRLSLPPLSVLALRPAPVSSGEPGATRGKQRKAME